ncbi:hypothetical protein LTR53_000856 [Teratosphaeriaceae sp. CCFEE 6253]|nr:hypothetical protein LTR53_000856 [Teratosphaeriaceae sp. CCFEE 6253]
MLLTSATLLIPLLGLLPTALGKLRTCRARDLPALNVFGLEITNITATEHRAYTAWSPFPLMPARHQPIDFCNITLTYTHPGQHDTIHIYLWLPLRAESWNGRFLAQGGGGWAAGFDAALAPSVALGYAAAITDAGHPLHGSVAQMADARTWLLASPGNLNWPLLQNFAARALDDLPKVAKQVVWGFYGEPARFAYWHGCSTGGRQGLMAAQRFPGHYDGILAAAPAINWATFVVAELWPHIVMRKVGYYPPHCEFEAIRRAAIEACDGLDGVVDGVIAAPGLCAFDATSIVGQTFDCGGAARRILAQAAEVANAVWAGPSKDGRSAWYGLPHETPFSVRGPYGPPTGLATTTCDENNENCKGVPFIISESWIRDVLRRGQAIDLTAMDEEEFWHTLRRSVNEFASVISTDDADLSEFKAAGGKMITWHGMADQLIPINGTSDYYDRVLALDPAAADHYRYFEAPGVQHCLGGPGAAPTAPLEALVQWVEQGVAPATLDAATVPTGEGGARRHRPLCAYPLVAAYVGGDVGEAGSYECAASFEVRPRHTEL